MRMDERKYCPKCKKVTYGSIMHEDKIYFACGECGEWTDIEEIEEITKKMEDIWR